MGIDEFLEDGGRVAGRISVAEDLMALHRAHLLAGHVGEVLSRGVGPALSGGSSEDDDASTNHTNGDTAANAGAVSAPPAAVVRRTRRSRLLSSRVLAGCNGLRRLWLRLLSCVDDPTAGITDAALGATKSLGALTLLAALRFGPPTSPRSPAYGPTCAPASRATAAERKTNF